MKKQLTFFECHLRKQFAGIHEAEQAVENRRDPEVVHRPFKAEETKTVPNTPVGDADFILHLDNQPAMDLKKLGD